DLQYRLAEATRQLVRAVADRYAESTGRLESALRTAATAREATADDAAQLDTRLAGRQRALGHVLTLLSEATEHAQAGGHDGAPGDGHDGARGGDHDLARGGDHDLARSGDHDAARRAHPSRPAPGR
ncbi:MAG TPA: hypothetical protein VGF54_12885, partial [Streptosporangiaceae bacterium]